MTKNDNLTNLTSQTNLTNLTTQTNQTNLTKHPKQIKHTHKVYSAWNYEKEIEDLNKASEEGWQLVKGGSFGSKFERNPNMQYRYQLDFRRVENMGRYIETFREQGWEYVNSTFNGWHYFRKLYDPALPEEAYEIFTDRQSLHEMNNRWARLALGIGIVLAAFAIFYAVWMILKPMLPKFVLIMTFVVECVLLLRGWWIMRNPDASRSRRGDGVLLAVFLAVILLGCTASIILSVNRPHMWTSQSAASVEKPIEDNTWNEFEVKYCDNYFLDLDLSGTGPVTFKILNEEGEAVYTRTSTDFHEKGIRLRLPRGTYCFSLSCSAGFSVNCEIE